jgi:DNA-binding transcriptional LysR family regulator
MARIDYNLFRVFDAVYTTGGVSSAAEVLHLTQPAISHARWRLREQVKDPLFVRLGQGMVPTPAAHKLIGPVRKGLREIEQAVMAIESFDPAHAVLHFRIGFNALMESALLPRIVKAMLLRARHPRGGGAPDRQDMAMALASAQLNAVIDIEMTGTGEMIHSQRLVSGRIVAVARRDHPLFAQQAITLADYGAAPRGGFHPAAGRLFEDMVIARTTTQARHIARAAS